jgi:hypothetical protein
MGIGVGTNWGLGEIVGGFLQNVRVGSRGEPVFSASAPSIRCESGICGAFDGFTVEAVSGAGVWQGFGFCWRRS